MVVPSRVVTTENCAWLSNNCARIDERDVRFSTADDIKLLKIYLYKPQYLLHIRPTEDIRQAGKPLPLPYRSFC